MQSHTGKFEWMSRSMALFFCLVVATAGTAFAQDESTAPAPPPDQAPSLQQAAPESQVRAVRISAVEGGVKVLQDGETTFHQAELNMPVVEGMKLVTAQDGRVEVQFEDGSVARVAPNSSVTLKQLARDEDGRTVTLIQAHSGLTYYELNGRAGQYMVQFGQDNIVIAPVDDTIFRLDLDKLQVELAVMHGSVHISDDENLAADVHTDQSVKFDPQNADEYQLVQSVEANSWDQWNSDRDEALATMDANESEARAGLDEPDNPAWSDLDANGDWYDVPGYGTGWTPSGVGTDWDPYGLGAWGYYSGIGYTWISGYSWGWWPYHCGAWSWFNSFGWMWFPGNCGWGGVGVGGWYPYGTIRHMPPGYRCPRRPRWAHYPQRPRDHGPHHGPVLRNPRLIAVNRGESHTRQIKILGKGSTGKQAAPRVLDYDGQAITPVVTRIHPLRGGPLGEGFRSTVRRTNPGLINSGIQNRGRFAGSMYRPSVGVYRTEGQPTSRPVYRANPGLRMPERTTSQGPARTPTPVFRAPTRAPEPVYRAPSRAPTPVFRGPSRAPAPVFHAPPPAFHPAPPPSFHAPAATPAGHGRH
jgi:hypothetical protein